MQDSTIQHLKQRKGRAIGGWLWLLAISLLASVFSTSITLITTTTEFLQDDWREYFVSSDKLLNTRVNIYMYLIFSMVGGLWLLVWTITHFFKRTKKFINIFLGLIGYSLATEIIRILLLEYYAGLTDQDTNSLESNLAKVGIIGIIAGLYLHKGKRPQQTFVN